MANNPNLHGSIGLDGFSIPAYMVDGILDVLEQLIGQGLLGGSGGTTTPGVPVAYDIPYASTSIAPADSASWCTETLTGDTILDVSGTPVEGQALSVAFFASGGARNVSLPSGKFKYPDSSTAASPIIIPSGKETVVSFRWSIRLSKWRVVAEVEGY